MKTEEVKNVLLLTPNQMVSVRHTKEGTSIKATVLEAGEGVLSINLPGSMVVEEGDELELETTQQDDALYIIKGRVLEAGPGESCRLKVVDEPLRQQRRRAQRVPTSLKAEYLQLFKKKPKGNFQQGMILDISSGGALLSVEEPLEPSSELLLMFEVPLGWGEDLTTGISGKVVREHRISEQSAHSYGVQFDKPLAFLNH